MHALLHPCSRPPPTPPLKTPGHSQASPCQSLAGSLLLSPGSWCAQGLVCALRESVSPALCKYWELYGRINGDLFQKGLYHTQVCCTQSPCPCLLTRTSAGDTPTLKGRSGLVSVASPVVHKVLFEPSKHLWWVWGLILNVILSPLSSCWGLSFALRCGVSFFGGIQCPPINDCSAVSYNFGVLTGEIERTFFYFTNLSDKQKRCPFHYMGL